MAKTMSQVIEKHKLDIVIPEKRLFPTGKGKEAPLYERYYVLSKKIEIFTFFETVHALQNMHEEMQIKIAKQISLLILYTGFMGTNFENIRWSKQLQKIAIIDTAPQGFFIAAEDDREPQNMQPDENSPETCLLIGLAGFKMWADSKEVNLPIFSKTVADGIELIKKNLVVRK
ncbi:MAG: hypothetical protein QRY74_00340 [Chlamydia sp.]